MAEATGKVEVVYTSKRDGTPLLTGDGKPFWNVMVGGTRYTIFDSGLFPLLKKGNNLAFEFSVSKDGQFHNMLKARIAEVPADMQTDAPHPRPATGGFARREDNPATQESIVRQSAIKAAAEITAMAGMPWPEKGEGYVDRMAGYTLDLAGRFLEWAMEPYRQQEREKVMLRAKDLWRRGKLVGITPPEPPKPDAPIGQLILWCENTEPVVAQAEEDVKKKAAQASTENPWADE